MTGIYGTINGHRVQPPIVAGDNEQNVDDIYGGNAFENFNDSIFGGND